MASAEQRTSWRSALRRVLSDDRDEPDVDDRVVDDTEVGPAGPVDERPLTDGPASAAGPVVDGGRRADPPVGGPAPELATMLERRVEEAVLHAPRRYSRRQVHQLTGISPARARRLWRSMGFADVGEDDVMFTEGDLAAIGQLEQLSAAGLVPTDVQDAVIRSMAQAMAGLANWQIEMLYQLRRGQRGEPDDWPSDLREVLPALENMQTYVWRRHLITAAGRLLDTAPGENDVRTLVVGSADLVGFTRTSRRLTPAQLIELVDVFYGIATAVIAEHRGRIVKTVGDAVLFVADHPENAAEIALDLVDRTTEAAELPELRTGLAIGPTVTRFGDIYGEVVDTAARLCTHARPGRILVDHALATALDGDRRFQLRLRRPLAERGYPRLQPWGLRRAPVSDEADELEEPEGLEPEDVERPETD